MQTLALHTIPFALIPAVCWYIGVTTQGWTIMGDPVKLTPESALPMCVLFYLAMVAGVIFLGFMVNWMAATYSTAGGVGKGVALISYTASPFFLAGFLGLYPVLWLDIMIGTIVACYCIYLLFLGTGPVMEVPPERSFLYAAAVFAVALVSFRCPARRHRCALGSRTDAGVHLLADSLPAWSARRPGRPRAMAGARVIHYPRAFLVYGTHSP